MWVNKKTFMDDCKPLAGELAVRIVGLSDPWLAFKNRKSALTARCKQLDDHTILLGDNLVVNQARTVLQKLVAGVGYATSEWVIGKMSWGSGDEPPKFSDITLSPQPIEGVGGGSNQLSVGLKVLSSVNITSPYMAQFEAILGTEEENGQTIREAGLWTFNETLFARKTFPGILKTNDFAISFLWSIRL